MTRWTSGPAVLWATALLLLLARGAAARSRDFIDETQVSEAFKAREFGIEFGAESRVDSDYRVQGWYTGELESSPTASWFLETKIQGVGAGSGLDLGAWVFGSRYRLLPAPRFPVDVSVGLEYETFTDAGKHPAYERELVPRVMLTRTFDTVLATVNLSLPSRLTPNPDTRFSWGAGVRWPDGGPLMAGLEAVHEGLEKSTRITPQLWLRFPREMDLRIGGVIGTDPRPYHFIARAIFETEF